ncbi:(d)CMP kinase [Thermoleophilia bacterium SCSIO 60948]|nr:(d)CMP kinase [Thermoleophilia bacterium SCSIO 60948]
MVIAIDGPAGAGKSTVARAVAARLGFTYLDTGAMYRCVALAARRNDTSLDDEKALGLLARSIRLELDGERVALDGADVGEEIRTREVSDAASQVAVHPAVREAMVTLQRRQVETGGWVAEGRDIGTVVAPEAPLKIFLDASPEERARRRAAETGAELEATLADLIARDARDSARATGALAAARDSVRLDTTGLDADGVAERVVELARERGLTEAR